MADVSGSWRDIPDDVVLGQDGWLLEGSEIVHHVGAQCTHYALPAFLPQALQDAAAQAQNELRGRITEELVSV